ncbi:MAG TPA: OmpA family protein [Thermohalobaculum sp.]|nr:OmpA family protein [Thermohalobaculum sp.]
MRIIKTLAVLATGTALAACSSMTAGPAGEGPESHLFGVATDQNFNAQLAYGDPAGRIRALNDAFRAAAQDTVTFEFNSAALDSEARRALDGQAKWLKENPAVRMTIVGHTDLVGTDSYNDRLGLRRARAVVSYLVNRGIARKRLDAVESRGEREPVVATEDRERRNRRSVTSVAGFDRMYVGGGMDARIGDRLYGGYAGPGVQANPT